MGKMAAMSALLGLWMLAAAGRSEAISTGQSRLDSMHIVHMDPSFTGGAEDDATMYSHLYSNLLQAMKQEANTFSESDDASAAHPVHVYRHAFHGFSTVLTDEEAKILGNMQGVLGVHPDQVRQLQTTHTPEFLGLSDTKGLWPQSDFGEDVIVGVLDTGVWPESASFSDEGIGPIPARWKGICQVGKDFNASHCNKKLIGARWYSNGYEQFWGKLNETMESRSARDTEGHGSHTSSTAAGAAVANASLFGFAAGTARGMATKARIAMYKICWTGGCLDSDIAAAFDQAVADSVDVISLSVGGGVTNLPQDSIAIGAFGAMRKNIFVSCAAGNDGPKPFSVSNVAPWVTTVAASTVDRKFPASVHLGNGKGIAGVSLYRYDGNLEHEKIHGLVYGGDVALKHVNATDSAMCLAGSLNPALVKGKIVLCVRGSNGRAQKGAVVKEAGGAGMVLANDAPNGEALTSDSHVLPATAVSAIAGAVIIDYIKSGRNPVAKLKFGHFGGTLLDVKHSPAVASFSSRGPNSLTPSILKPDITAPGVNILAAWTGLVGPSSQDSDNRRVPFNIISGTSMSCPHVSGLGALLKGAHPSWSPAAIKSAMMTTATVTDNSHGAISDESTSKPANPYQFGSGHVRPELALSPGLVYDMGTEDYVHFLCAMGYTYYQIKIFTGEGVYCPVDDRKPRIEDFNYPSFSAVYNTFANSTLSPITFKRTVTNVGYSKSTYKATIVSPEVVSISVHPKELTFSEMDEKKTFTLTVMGTKSLVDGAVAGAVSTVFGSIQWSDGHHVVQSPIGVTVLK